VVAAKYVVKAQRGYPLWAFLNRRGRESMLAKLTLIVTHDCNLNCTYCYAEGGDFGLAAGAMSKDTAIEAVEHFTSAFNGIGEIFFFGGEPLLALDTIEAVCDKTKTLFEIKRLASMPIFTIITNGMAIKKRFIKLAKEYDFGITVSLDGPALIHNMHRVTKTGKGSFQKVMKGIELLKENNISFSTECTYTKEHWDAGYKPIDIYSFLQSIGAEGIILTEQFDANEIDNSPEGQINTNYKNELFESSVDLFSHAINECMDCGKLNHAGLEKAYDSILKKPKHIKERYCGAGFNNFAVNPTGETYPCHMLNNQQEFSLGNFSEINTPVEIIPKKEKFEECTSCPVKDLCRACPARMYFYNNSKYILPIESECKTIMAFSCIAQHSLTHGAHK